MSRRVTIFAFGVAAYLVGFGALLYTIGFIGGYGTPTQLDGPASAGLLPALAVNLALCLLFALQHSGMARPAFKRFWTRFVPREAERSIYLVATGLVLALLFWQWRPMGGVVWDVRNDAVHGVLHAAYFAGWAMVFLASFLINHFDLFGLRQVWLCLRGKPYTEIPFSTPMLYSAIRHPIYTGVLMASWAAPTMGVGRLVFALAMTAYIVKAYRWEERDLVAHLGDAYKNYQRRVPALVPSMRKAPPAPVAEQVIAS